MALVSCKTCSNPISSSAEKCPKCADRDPLRKKRNLKVFLSICLLALGAYVWFVYLPDVRENGLFSEISGQHR